MKKRYAVLLCITVAVVTAFVCVTVTSLFAGLYIQKVRTEAVSDASESEEMYSILNEVMEAIEDISYYGVDDETKEDMVEQAAKGIVYGLDEDLYAYLYSPEEYEELLEDDEGTYCGIGVLVQQDYDANMIKVVRVYDDTPAREAGVKQGDYFYAVDGESCVGLDLYQIQAKVRGEEGTTVHIDFLRDGETRTCDIVRKTLISQRTEYKMVEGDIAYFSIDSFEGNAATLFKEGVEELVNKQGAQGLILDLRSNPGGDKSVVLDIADVLLPAGPAFMTVDKYGNTTTESTTSKELGIPLVVLINGDSASASELLTANIQDYGVGTVIGTTSYGKGTVQTFHMLSDGYVLKLTEYRYRTGHGTDVQDVGVTPDIVVEPEGDLESDYLLRTTEADNQYQAAVEEIRRLIEIQE